MLLNKQNMAVGDLATRDDRRDQQIEVGNAAGDLMAASFARNKGFGEINFRQLANTDLF